MISRTAANLRKAAVTGVVTNGVVTGPSGSTRSIQWFANRWYPPDWLHSPVAFSWSSWAAEHDVGRPSRSHYIQRHSYGLGCVRAEFFWVVNWCQRSASLNLSIGGGPEWFPTMVSSKVSTVWRVFGQSALGTCSNAFQCLSLSGLKRLR